MELLKLSNYQIKYAIATILCSLLVNYTKVNSITQKCLNIFVPDLSISTLLEDFYNSLILCNVYP